MNDTQLKVLEILVNGGYVPIDRFSTEELAALDDLVNLGYALVNPTEPVQEAYATETGCRALVMEKEVHRQRAEQKADQERDNISNRRAANRDGWSNVVSAVIGAVVGAVVMWVLERFF